MLKNIPYQRLLFYGMLLGILPTIFVLIPFISQLESLNQLEDLISSVQEKALIREKKQALNMAVIDHYRDADHFYIDKYLETLSFLEPEIENLQKLVNTNFAYDDTFKKRLEQLTNENNLVFTEGVVQSTPLFQETTETLVRPVEVNTEDLKKILSCVEEVSIANHEPSTNAPQLLILNFKIDRKNISEKNEIYNLNLKLIKREFL